MKRIVPIKGYENEYMISDNGSVFRIENNGLSVIKNIVDKYGYYRVCLCKENKKRIFSVHRLVAEMFIPKIDESATVINHKDENKQNNNVENLEWCTVAYNNAYNNGYAKRGEKRRKPIVAFKNGETLNFKSITEASRTLGISHGNIVMCLQGKRKTASGYSFYHKKG